MALLLAALALLSSAATTTPGDGDTTTPGRPAPTLLPPVRLRTDHAAQRLSIQHQRPRLSWALMAVSPATRGLRQAAFQLQLSDATHQILWDSGKVASNRSVLEHCCGAAPAVVFTSDTSYSWRVMVWQTSASAAAEQPSPWSAPARFDTALLSASEWGARWLGTGDGIGAPGSERNLFRTEFVLPATKIVQAGWPKLRDLAQHFE